LGNVNAWNANRKFYAKYSANWNTRNPHSLQKKDVLENEGVGLLDGQQRTLAMLLGWRLPHNDQQMDRRVWADFYESPEREHLFRLRLTTENHKFGFKPDAGSPKLIVLESIFMQNYRINTSPANHIMNFLIITAHTRWMSACSI